MCVVRAVSSQTLDATEVVILDIHIRECVIQIQARNYVILWNSSSGSFCIE